jgi:hypothetical protein
MPVYLLHGFRWPRAGNTGIRIHCILHNLDDCSSDYIQNSNSTAALLESFRKLFPDIMKELEGPGKGLTFLEQYDPEDETSEDVVSQPFAFVGDRVVTIASRQNATASAGQQRSGSETSKSPERRRSRGPGETISSTAAVDSSALSLNVEEVVAEGPGFTSQAWEALAELRDKLAEKEKIGWWIVYNGDPERAFDVNEEDKEDEEDEKTKEELDETPADLPTGKRSPITNLLSAAKEVSGPASPKPAVSPTTSGNMPPDTTTQEKDATGKQMSGLPPIPEQPAVMEPQAPPKPRAMSKTEGIKKFFGKRSRN